MVKKLLLLFVAIALIGCAYEGQELKTYIKNPRWFIKDPHFANYKDKRNALESSYLNKELTYAEYVEEMNGLDETYAKEVQERDAKIAESY